jgi:hypothetical protein
VSPLWSPEQLRELRRFSNSKLLLVMSPYILRAFGVGLLGVVAIFVRVLH